MCVWVLCATLSTNSLQQQPPHRTKSVADGRAHSQYCIYIYMYEYIYVYIRFSLVLFSVYYIDANHHFCQLRNKGATTVSCCVAWQPVGVDNPCCYGNASLIYSKNCRNRTVQPEERKCLVEYLNIKKKFITYVLYHV